MFRITHALPPVKVPGGLFLSKADGADNHFEFRGFTWPRFTQVPNEAFSDLMPRLSGAAFKVLMAIAHKVLYYGREDGYAPVGYSEIIQLTGLHKDSVRRAVKECLEVGCIEVVEEFDATRSLCRMYGLRFAPGHGPNGNSPQSGDDT